MSTQLQSPSERDVAESVRRLLTSRETRERLGFRTKTNHTLRALELAGLLKPVRLNSRTLRYDPRDVERLIATAKA